MNWNEIVVWSCEGILCALLVGALWAWNRRSVWGTYAGRRVEAMLCTFCVIATVVAQKYTVTVDRLLVDAGCYATNDVFHVAVSNAPAYAAIDFSSSAVYVYAREHGLTNAADWIELTPRRTFGELPADYAIANATNHNYMLFIDYIPPSPVHTNGVFELKGFLLPPIEEGDPAATFLLTQPKLED